MIALQNYHRLLPGRDVQREQAASIVAKVARSSTDNAKIALNKTDNRFVEVNRDRNRRGVCGVAQDRLDDRLWARVVYDVDFVDTRFTRRQRIAGGVSKILAT